MALVLDATVGGTASNTYATFAEFQAYIETRPTVWDGTEAALDDPTEVNKALVQATQMLNEYIEWYGDATSRDQALPWPRFGMVMENGYLMDSDVLPDRLKRATCELAVQLLEGNLAEDSDANAQGLKEIQVGPVDLVYKDGTITGKAIPDRVWRMVAIWGRLLLGASSVEAVRV